jgi:hypothetical protein
LHQKPCNDATIWSLWRARSHDFAKFPVKFPVSRENGQSRGRSALLRQPTSPISRDSLYDVAQKPAVGGLLALGGESPVAKFDVFLAAVPKISTHLRQGGRFLEKRFGDCVRLHCVTNTGGGGMHKRFGIELAFKDAAGQLWVRQGDGTLKQVKKHPLDLYNISRPVGWES